VIAFAVMQFFLWIYFAALIATGPNPPKWDRSGIKKHRMNSLIRFSFPFIFMLLVDSSLSVVMLIVYARFGSLALLPALSFTTRGPVLLGSLANRTMWAFYPGFLRLQLTDQADLLRGKQQHLATLTLSVALFLAGAILAFNRTLVELIAGPDFFAGVMTNTWLALSVLIGFGMQLFRNFLHLSGSMGKVTLVCVGSLVLAVGLSWIGYRFYGLPGMVAPYLLPGIALGWYGLHHGVPLCGYNRSEISRNPILVMGGYSLVLLAFGVFASAHSETMGRLCIFGKPIHLPSYSEMAAFGVCAVVSLIGAYRATRGFHHLATRVPA
jgi:O-antigen/teichoic acid export membrane protein